MQLPQMREIAELAAHLGKGQPGTLGRICRLYLVGDRMTHQVVTAWKTGDPETRAHLIRQMARHLKTGTAAEER